MSRFDRYLLSQFLALFGFFALILVMVYWVNRAVGLFDRLIGNGQTALVFIEFSLLTLPNVIRLVLPVAAFVAVVHVANRLMQEGELVVMQATGFSSFRLARPVFLFGLSVGAMMMLLTHFAVPASRALLAERTAEISANATARLLSEGRFMHPAEGITLYIREISDVGELRDIYLADDSGIDNRVSYIARRALLVRGDGAPKLVMFEGLTQTLNRGNGRLSVTHFADLTYDLAAFLGTSSRDGWQIDELTTPQILRPTPEILARTGATKARLRATVHTRMAQPLLAVAAALVGFSALLLGAFSRFGLWRQILGAIVLLILVQMVDNAATAAVLRRDAAWPLAYAAPVFGIALGVSILWLSQRPRRLPRRPADDPAQGAAQGAVQGGAA